MLREQRNEVIAEGSGVKKEFFFLIRKITIYLCTDENDPVERENC